VKKNYFAAIVFIDGENWTMIKKYGKRTLLNWIKRRQSERAKVEGKVIIEIETGHFFL
jgi:hypothetical protein